MQIIIPMSGTGSRFLAKGYREIKPLVNVFNKPIIKYIVNKFSKKDDFLFICREEHLLNKKLDLKNTLEKLAPNVKIVCVENHKLGPVHSLMQIEKYIDPKKELIVNYCDFDWRWNYEDFKKWLALEKPKAALCVYSGFHPHYINPAPYAHIRNNQHNVIEIKEKQSFTKYREEEPAASGTFYFSSGKLLLDASKWLIDKGEVVNGEFYVSLLFNYFPLKGMRTLTFQISHFMQWGTPEDLEEFLFFAKKVPLNFKKNVVGFPALTLMAGKGNRMKSIDSVKKPYLHLGNKLLFQLCTENFNSEKINLYAVNGDEEDNKYLDSFDDLKKIHVGETESAVETLFYSLEKSLLSNNDGILVLPCDASIDLDWNKFINKYEHNYDFDAVIFSFSGYPYAQWTPTQYGWLEVDNQDYVKKIGNKKGWDANFANPIITGYFWFPNIGKLKVNLDKFLQNLRIQDKEPSVDQFCEFLVKHNKKVISYQVDDFLCLGTPMEFRDYEYWLEANDIEKIN